MRNIHDNWKDYELEKKHNVSTDIFIKILDNVKIVRQKNYFETFNKIIKHCIAETENEIKKNLKIRKKKTVRHYQSISSFEIRKRNISSLKYIKDYFNGYITWLNLIKKI